jgi:hypothetical protein
MGPTGTFVEIVGGFYVQKTQLLSLPHDTYQVFIMWHDGI